MVKGGGARHLASIVAVVSLIAGLVIAAVRAEGYREPDFDLHDSAIWATRSLSGGGEIGRVNTELYAIDVRVAATGERFDVVQEGPVVLLVEPDNGLLKSVDLRTAASPIRAEVEIPKGADVRLGGGTLAVADRGRGVVHVGEAPSDGTPIVPASPSLEVGSAFELAVGIDGVAHVLIPEEAVVVHLGPDGRERGRSNLPGPVGGGATVSAVGSRAVVADPAGGRLIVAGGRSREVAIAGSPSVLALQLPGASASTVLFATENGLAEAPLGDGEVRMLFEEGTGKPAEPVRLGSCRFGAWSGTARHFSVCGDGEPRWRDMPNIDPQGILRFRVNRDRAMLNELLSGQVLLHLEGEPQTIADWEKALRPEEGEVSAITDSGRVEVTPVVRDLLQEQENKPPIAVDDSFGLRPGMPATVNPLRNDSDPNGDLLTLVSLSEPPDGWRLVIVQGQRAVQVSPPEFATSGSAGFRYVITDGRGGVAEAAVSLVLRGLDENSDPVARPDRLVVEAGGRAVVDVLANDEDPDGDPLTLRSATAASGTVQFHPEGRITFQAPPTTGEVVIEYTVVDGRGGAAVQRLTVEVVRAGNVPPVAVDDRVTSLVGREVSVDVLANDTDVNGDPLRLVQLSEATGVRVSWAGNGIVRLTPEVVGTFDFAYEVSDGQASDRALLRLTATETGGNTPPVAVLDRVQVRPGVPSAVDLLANDLDDDGDVLVIQGLEAPEAAPLSLELLDRRVLRVTASSLLEEMVPVRYWVSDGVESAVGVVQVIPDLRSATNQPPILADDEVLVRVGNVTSVLVLDNDVDPDGDDLIVLGVGDLPAGDGILVNQHDSLRYLAPDVPRGGIRATYTVVDTFGNRADGSVLIRVIAVDPAENRAPDPRLVEARTIRDRPVSIPIRLVGMDPEGDPVTIVGIVDPPSRGTVVQDRPDRFVYEPDRNETGSDRFTYLVRDSYGAEGIGVVLVGIAPPAARNSPPMAVPDRTTVAPDSRVRIRVLANDSDADGDEIVLSPIEPLGTPSEGAVAVDEGGDAVIFDAGGVAAGSEVVFDYGIIDGRGGTARGIVTVLVTEEAGEQLAPVARDDVVGPQRRGSTVEVEVLANDEDPDGERSALEVSLAPSAPARVGADGVVIVEVGEEPVAFVYTITDPQGLSASAVVQVPVLPPEMRENRPPTANPDRADARAGETVTIDVLANDSDPDGDDLYLVEIIERDVPRGRAEIADGRVRFTADTNAEGTGGFSYRVSDGQADAIGTASVVIAGPVNRPPVATALTLDVPAGGSASLDLSRAVTDPDPEDRHTYSDVQGGAEGITATLSGATLEVRAEPTAFGRSGRLTYIVSDGREDGSATGTVDVSVTSSDRPPPRANPDTVLVYSTAAAEIDVLANDVDPIGQGLTIVGVTTPTAGGPGGPPVGTAEVAGRRISYRPAADFNGIVRFSYTVRDVTDQPDRRSTAAVEVTVVAPPDPPAAPLGAPSDSRVDLIWSAPSPNGSPITEYVVTRSPGGVETRHQSTSAAVTGLVNGTSYTFTVRAVNAAGEGPASPPSAAFVPNALPDVPEPPTARFGDGSIAVSWVAPPNRGTPITGYVLEISSGGRQTVTATSYTWTGLTNGAPYRFRVAAINAASDPQSPQFSAYSAEESPAGVPARPGPPNGTRGNGEILLTWSAPAANGAELLEYEIRPYAGGSAQAVIREANPNTTSRSITGLNNGTSYEFDLRARNKAGWSEWSPRSPAVTPATTPAQPGTPSATNADDGRSILSFAPPTSDGGSAITGYRVRINGGSSQALSADRTVTGLTNGTQYQFQVEACNQVGCGPSSASSNQIIPVGPPGTPSVSGSTSGIRITWNWTQPAGNGAAITGYEYRIDGGAVASTTGTTHSVDVGWGTTRRIEVRALNAAGKSGSWAASSQTTASPVPAAPSISGSVSGTTINWNWTEPSGNGAAITGYEYRVNGGGVNSTTGRSLGIDVGYSQTRTIEVRSLNAAGNRSGWASNSQTTPPPPPPPPSVTIEKGADAQGKPGCVSANCRYLVVRLRSFAPNTTYAVDCRSSRFPSNWCYTSTTSYSIRTDGAGNIDSSVYYFGYCEDVWVFVNGVRSNTVRWC